MKKIFVFILVLLININVYAIDKNDTISVTLNKCIDGDTASFNYKDEVIKVRFLAIDTPELKDDSKRIIKYGNEAKDFTCEKLKRAKKITIEFDNNNDITDKYGRYLGWIFVDDNLLQEEIVKNGYAKVAYLYGDYKYTDTLLKAEKNAKSKKLNIWQDEKDLTIIQIALIITVVIIVVLLKTKKKKRRKRTKKNIG